MTSELVETTAAERAAATKRADYAATVLHALAELVQEPSRKRLLVSDICRAAGVSTDSLYKEYHKELRSQVEHAIDEWRVSKGRRKRKRPSSEIEQRLLKVEAERDALRKQLHTAQQALDLLGQMLETALAPGGKANVVPLAIHRPRK